MLGKEETETETAKKKEHSRSRKVLPSLTRQCIAFRG